MCVFKLLMNINNLNISHGHHATSFRQKLRSLPEMIIL